MSEGVLRTQNGLSSPEKQNNVKYNSKRISIPRAANDGASVQGSSVFDGGIRNGLDEEEIDKENDPQSHKFTIDVGQDSPTPVRKSKSNSQREENDSYGNGSQGEKSNGTGSYSKGKLAGEGRRGSKDGSRVVSNPWSLFNKYEDKQESRYKSDEEEYQMNSLGGVGDGGGAEGEGDENVERMPATYTGDLGNHQRGQSFSNFLPSKRQNKSNQQQSGAPGNNANGVDQDMSKSQNLKRKFQFFGRKRNKDRDDKKQDVAADEVDQEEDNPDRATGERAQLLIGSLLMGSTSINLVASRLLEDERGLARSPLLLNLIGFRILDASPNSSTKNRKMRIDLEYGVGPQRMKWTVEKTAKDLLYLHSKFKFDNWRKEVVGSKNSELPKYPMPPLRAGTNADTSKGRSKPPRESIQASAHSASEEPQDDDQREPNQDVSSILTGRSVRGHLSHLRAYLSSGSSNSSLSDEQSPEQLRSRFQKNQEYIKLVTNYLKELIKVVSLKPQSNRLFQFFELSPISSLLSYETGYLGKQGVIHIGGTSKSQGWRVGHFRAIDVKSMIDRRSEKWLLVRNSYVMYVSDINSTSPLEVFLVDPKFKISYKGDEENILGLKDEEESDYDDSSLVQKVLAKTDEEPNSEVQKKVFKHLKITLENAERKLVVIPKSFKEHKLWIKSLTQMKQSTVWSMPHRFDSFAPVRKSCFAQWFVDGRDYFWAVSSALEMAKDVIFIHDWWLSPELYLRRPANGNQQWRIDRILQRKAQQGVKVFVIVYRNVGSTVATDSLYTKHSILSLNEENIHVLRSPNQLLQNTYFWAHHEKLCIVDQAVAFVGGIDLCYGRYDTPDHVLVDDSKIDFNSLNSEYPATEDFVKFQTFPGKDYSNPRVKDFFELDKPYESMYDRNLVPRMPWHDVHMVTAGKVARDLARHFVQRWNYLLRQKRPSRYTPLLTPPPDLTDEEAEKLRLNGSCEVQLLRSSGNWSLGLKEHEQSIQNAYLKLIETSEHFVYIENQFFVTSCVIDGNEIQNRIGDAIVDRIIRAHNEGTYWRAIIVIPLMPGFESQVDEPDGSSVRVIMQCQYMSISRGATSIYTKLKKYGIDPDDYIQFFSLRKWGIIGPDRNLVTEQLYVHAKTMVVDDRAAIIGSANINERSMRGSRDSEVAAVVRDKATVKTKMNGEDYVAGKFPYTLRTRLMREHLGVNVDILDIVERRFSKLETFASTNEGMRAATSSFKNRENIVLSAMVELASRDVLNQPEGTERWCNFQKSTNSNDKVEIPLLEEEEEKSDQYHAAPLSLPLSFSYRTGTNEANKGIRDKKKHSYDARVQNSESHKLDVFGEGPDKYKSKLAKRTRLNSNRFLRDLAVKAMRKNPTGVFLPDSENVLNFLESDDFHMVDEMDDESEQIISERNKERWLLLKKISYLQRVAAITKDQTDEEAKKRSFAGMDPYPFDSVFKNIAQRSHSRSSPELLDCFESQKVVSTVDVPTDSSVSRNFENTGEGVNMENLEKRQQEHHSSEPYNEDIPIVTIDEQGAQDLIQSISSKGNKKFNNFIDPYSFEDPLVEEFYEDVWYECARRNTELYRLIFHTQPDNNVLTWKDYKLFTKLNSAFALSQQQEAKRRRKNKLFDVSLTDASDSITDSDNELEDYRHSEKQNGRGKTINVNAFESKVGLLGMAPPSVSNSSDRLSSTSRRDTTPRPENLSEKPIPEDDGEEYTDADSVNPQANGNGWKKPHIDHTISRDKLLAATPEKGPQAHLEDQDHLGNGEEPEPDKLLPTDNNTLRGSVSDNNLLKSRRHRSKTFSARRKATLGENIFDRESAERILKEIQGHLVLFPADWLSRELDGGNWFYNTDRIPPIDIYD